VTWRKYSVELQCSAFANEGGKYVNALGSAEFKTKQYRNLYLKDFPIVQILFYLI
jgi:hypothetical protein